MRILVYPHDLNMGGSQLNAIELAAAVRALGHDVIMFGQPGSLTLRIKELGLEFIAAPKPHHQPSRTIVRALAEVIRDRKIDIVHGYEWPPALESRLAADRNPGTAVVCTVMSMAVAPFIPKTMPLLVGTREILDTEVAFGRASVGLLEPPVDVKLNNPFLELPLDDFRKSWNLDPDAHTVVLVTRLAQQLKLEGIIAAIKAVGALAAEMKIQLLLVGDGPERDIVRATAQEINALHGPGTIVLTGQLEDPRPAYLLADVALGMGGSALRAMAFAKPLIVQGEMGYWNLVTPETLPEFLEQGWFGVGQGKHAGEARLVEILRRLLPDEKQRTALGELGRRTVQDRFSLDRAAEFQEDFYRQALSAPRRSSPVTDALAVRQLIEYQVAAHAKRLFGRLAADDFNARPVRARTAARAKGSTTSPGGMP